MADGGIRLAYDNLACLQEWVKVVLQATWRIELLGGLRVRQGDRVVERFRTQKAGALLAYLAYHAPRLHSRELLVDLFWPEMEPEAARHNLRQTLTNLRHDLALPESSEADLVVTDRLSIQLRPGAFTTDVADLETALQEAQRAATTAERTAALARAVALYQGELLPGHFEEWVQPERAALADRYLETLRQLAADAEQAGDLLQSLHFARRMLACDPLDENAHCHIIRLYAAVGRPLAAQNQYQELERILKTELDTVPSAQANALVQNLRSDAAARPAPKPSVSVIVPPQKSEWPTPGGALPPDSPLYIARQTDQAFQEGLARRESVVLIKGARQIGKTSLLARGLHQARMGGVCIALADLQKFNADSLASLPAFYQALAQTLSRRFPLRASLAERWKPQHSANTNFENYLLDDVLPALPGSLVWAIDEIDQLFTRDFGSEVFSLLRSWHNERALDPDSPWSRLTLAMAYATEAHLFITDLNQSPFNVGLRLELEDFTRDQVAQLNRAYGAPLTDEALTRFYDLVGGLPYLAQRGLYTLAIRSLDFETFLRQADQDDGPLGDYLRHLLVLLLQNPPLAEAVRYVLQGQPCPSLESFYRLRSAGLLTGPSHKQAQLRCRLYARYLERHLL